MVTLLVLSCTGMVWAQQNEGSGFRPIGGTSNGSSALDRSSDGGSSIPTVPIVNDESSTARRGQTGQRAEGRLENRRTGNAFSTPRTNERAAASSETSRMLDTNRSVQDSFQPGSTGFTTPNSTLSSSRVSASSGKPLYLGLPQEAMSVLLRSGRVVAPVKDPYHDKIKISDQNTPKAGPTRTIQPRLIGDSLVFTFTQDDVDFTHRGSLEFEVPAAMKHRYKSATIEIPEVLNRNSQASTTPPRNTTSFQSDGPRWKLPGQTTVRQPIQQNDPWAANQLATAERERQARLDYEARMREQQEARERATLAEQNRQLQAQNSQLLYEQQQRLAAARVQPQQPVLYPPDRYAQNTAYGQIQQPIVTRPVVPPTTVDSYAMQQVNARLAKLDSDNFQLKNEVQRVKLENDSLRNRFDPTSESHVNHLAKNGNLSSKNDERYDDKPRFQNQKAMSVGRIGNDDPNRAKSGIDGIASGRQNNQNGNGSWLMMFLLLLISVGLNLYLWAISRGFYMRYQELADELRETFTVTA